ncbi:unnamed protein product [Leptosia nina]|uniref:Uncharacterized protein n=1 Tax=Leptosia nina TaxID=320188 RepID=A0AAV1JL53_9NEOP
MDLQKISEITFRDEKYNVLKPTVHMIRDHFEDVMQQRRNIEFPTNRIFMDSNGFRHFWRGMEIQPNLRKNNVKNNMRVNDTKTVTHKKQPNRKKKVVERVFVPNIKPRPLREGGTLVKTTFFCPFFGVLTMLAKVDLDLEEPKPES